MNKYNNENLESKISDLKINTNTPLIFNKKLINNTKIIPLKTIMNKVGPTKHFTPASQEWYNSVYAYNHNYTKLLPTADKQLMKLVQSYFNLYIKKYLYYQERKSKKLATRFRRLSVKRIFVGKGDLKHTSTKVVITLYVYNYERRKFMAKDDKVISNWFFAKPMNLKKYKKQALVRKLVQRNVVLSYKKWFNWKSYSLLGKNTSNIIEKFYLKKFFARLSLNRVLLKKKNIVKPSNLNVLDNKPLFIHMPLYNDYFKYISESNLKKEQIPSFDNFLNLIRIITIKNLRNLKKNRLDLSEKKLYLNYVRSFLSRFFFVNKRMTKVILRTDRLKSLRRPLGSMFRYRYLKRRYLVFKNVLYSYKGKTGWQKKKELSSFKLYKYMYIISNINIKNLVDFKRKDLNFKDITLYINHINNYLNKNLFLVRKNYIISLLYTLVNFRTRNLNFKNNTIYLEYYKYIFTGKFIYGNNPSFEDFMSLLDNLSEENLKNLKKKYKYFSSNKKVELKSKKRSNILKKIYKKKGKFIKNTMILDTKDIIPYSIKDLSKKALAFRKITLINYFKLTYLSLYKLMFNQNKFTNSFMKHLTRLVSNLYNKEVIFNIVDLRKLHLNSDIYTQAVSLKLRNRKNRLQRVLKKSLNRVRIPLVRRVSQRSNNLDMNELLLNRIRNIKINSILANYISNKDPLNKLLYNLYSKVLTYNSINSEKNNDNYNEYSILNTLKHSKMSGIRIEAKGRLTKRFTASRSVFKMKWIGGIKNIDSSFKRLSTPMLRGHAKSNVLYTNVNSKNRNGAFGVKGWISSK